MIQPVRNLGRIEELEAKVICFHKVQVIHNLIKQILTFGMFRQVHAHFGPVEQEDAAVEGGLGGAGGGDVMRMQSTVNYNKL